MLKSLKENVYVVITFFVAFFMMTLAFANAGMYPFGENQIMIIDSWHQYYPIFQEMHTKLTEGGSLFYSWNTGSGTNFFLMIAYYAMSPLYFMSFLFPKEALREVMLFATILKIAFAGAFFSYYIRKQFKKDDLSITFFGLLYAFSGYLMGFYWDIMWLDCVAILPLIVLGMHHAMFERKYKLYVVTLAIAVISNFYIGYFVCEFVLIYFFVLYFTNPHEKGLKPLLSNILQFGAYTAMSLGMTAIVILPVTLGMKMAYGYASGNPTAIETYHSLLDIFNNLLFNAPPTVIDGLPNIYSGMLSVFLLLLYFAIPSVQTKNKLIYLGLLAFLVFSFNINYLNFIWHGFHFPNQVPYRFSFVMSFVILTLAYQTYSQLHELSIKTITKVTAFFLLYLIINEKLYTELFDFKVFYASMAFLVVYSGTVVLYRHNKISVQVFAVILCYLIIGEASLTAINATEVAGSSGRKDYPTQQVAVQAGLKHLRESDPGFYRMEMFKTYSVNDPLLYRYPGISQFSSTSNSKFNTYAKKFGISADPGSNSILYLPNTPITNGLFAVKYMVSKHDAIPLPNVAYEIIKEEENIKVLKNKFSLPVAFMVNDKVQTLNLDAMSPFDKQQTMVNLATGRNDAIFRNVPVTTETYTNMERTKLDHISYAYKNLDTSRIGNGTLAFTIPNRGQAYAYMLNQSKTVTLKWNGKSETYETPRGVIMDLGVLEKDTVVEMAFEVPAAETGYFNMQVVLFDEDVYAQVHAQLADEGLQVTDYDDTHITGTIDVKEDGLLYTSIPYEAGWKATVDGVKAKITPYKDAVVALSLSKGTHEIHFSYIPAGFITGTMISLVSLMVFILSWFWPSVKTRLSPHKKTI